MNSYSIFVTLLGAFFLTWSLLTLFYRPFFVWKKRNQKNYTEKDYFVDRFIYPGGTFLILGTSLFLFGIITLSSSYFLPQKEFWFGFPYLIFAFIYLLLSLCLFIWKDFEKFFWNLTWHGSNLDVDKKWMRWTFLGVAVSLFFDFYLFSGIFLNWP